MSADEAEGEHSFSQEVEVRSGSIALAEHGQRLDKFLVAAAPELTRGFVQQLIDQGAARPDRGPKCH